MQIGEGFFIFAIVTAIKHHLIGIAKKVSLFSVRKHLVVVKSDDFSAMPAHKLTEGIVEYDVSMLLIFDKERIGCGIDNVV